LVPAGYRAIGVDIHPDPADNEARFPFPLFAETDALRQVTQQTRRAVVVHCCGPDDFAVWPNAWNVGWPSWETETVPYLREWPLRLGLMDAIWAKTTFMAEFARRAGYRGPIHAVPWPHEFRLASEMPAGLGAEIYTSYFEDFSDPLNLCRPRPLEDLRGQARLLFVAVQSLAARKGLPLLLSEWRAHVTASGGSDILVLRLAFRHAPQLSPDWRETFVEALWTAGFRRGPVRIAVIPMALSEAALSRLYRLADGFLSMTYGEGFGSPVVEALANDCPVIAPRHTGLRDLIPEDYPLIVASDRKAVALKGNLPVYPPSAAWHIPRPGELRQKLELFAAMVPAARQALVRQCRSHAMGFCWSPVVRQNLQTALKDLDLDGAARPPGPLAASEDAADAGRHAAD
jgi:glycosyltransferase involved in cell wall biosynthesis